MPTLEWIGKDKIVNHHMDVPFRVLERKYSFDESGQHSEDNGSENMIIHGDNLDALKALLPKYEGKIKCIYIDPPYNTGEEDWVYNDNVNDPKIKKWLGEIVGKEGEDLSRHDKWLCMIYPRLRLLQRLLHPQQGVIFISIDENEDANLKLICKEVFGATNHIATIAWQKRYSRENREAIGDSHEYILVYAKTPAVFKETRNLVPMNEEQAKVYKNPNNDPKGRWRPVPLTAQAGHATPEQFYEIKAPGGKIHRPPAGRCWGISKKTFEEYLAEGRIYFGKNNNSQPNLIRYLSEVDGVAPWTWWPHEEVGHTDEAKKEINLILGDVGSFETPKPMRLLSRIVHMATSPGDIILDSFAGSGTTAHAVLSMNKTDGGSRKFILIEMMDYAETTTAERVRRAIEGYANNEGTGGSFSFYELGDAILTENGTINENIEVGKIREYIYYSETREPLSNHGRNDMNPAFLGMSNGTAYYFHYEKDEATSLDTEFLSSIKEIADGYVIYADICLLSKKELEDRNIIFKKIPRDILKV